MDPQILISVFGPALWEVFKVLLEKGRDLALEQGSQPLKDWIASGYDERKDAETVRSVVLNTLEELKKSGELDQYDILFATLKLTNLDRKMQLALAGAAVEMTRFSPEMISPELIKALGLEEKNRTLLARFLFALREQLNRHEKYREGIQYANQLDQLGILRGLSAEMGLVAEKLDAMLGYEEALISERRLTLDDAQALKDYLVRVRQKWEGVILPLLRKKSGDITNAKLKQVFVPLHLQDTRMEEEARRRLERMREPEKLVREQDENVRPVEIGELLNRYSKFILIGPPGCGKTTLLSRAALAFAEGRAGDDLGWKGGMLFPIFLRLRNFGAFLKENRDEFCAPTSGSLIAYLENQFRDGDRIKLTADFFDRRLAEGNCLVLMDGLDEVSDLRSEVAGHIDAFVTRYAAHGNRFGLASRPRGYESVERQLRPVGLAVATVNPLAIDGIRQLMGNLLQLIEPDTALRARDLDSLTRAIEASEELTRIAGTPLFCAALVQVYKYHGARLPNRRVDVFDEIVDLLLGYWHAQQTRFISDAEQLALEDGTGRKYREVKDAVTVKNRRLIFLAHHMQRTYQAEIRREEAEQVLFEYLKTYERVPDEETARLWAENFLLNSHERSGLLVERDPEIYTFLHKGFMEFLAASALVNQSKTLADVVLSHLTDEKDFGWWEQVILLAGAHPKLAEDVRVELVTRLLETAERLPAASFERVRHQIVAGELACDMADYLPAPEHEAVEKTLFEAAVDDTLLPVQRAKAADTLDELGYSPPDLYAFLPIPEGQGLLSKYLVTNAQYERFLNAPDFAERKYWVHFPKFDEESGPMKKTWGEEGWKFLNENLDPNGRLEPRSWRDPRFGLSRRHAPVVGISWFEASAYCQWLREHWETLDEGKQGLVRPLEVRLPTEAEWSAAAGGEADDRYAWGVLKNTKEITRFANTSESGIGRTTPVWMYPQGHSPAGMFDLSGNVWEWQANYQRVKEGWLALRGGSWGDVEDFARVAIRDDNHPYYRLNLIGFRVWARPQ